MKFSTLFSVALLVLAGCTIHEEPQVYHDIVTETIESGQIEAQLTWTVNGEPDDGMLADMDLFMSRSKDMEDAEIINGTNNGSVGSLNFYGGRRMIPSNLYMYPAYRFFLGVTFNGILDPSASLTYPLHVQYQIKLFFRESKKEIKTITGDIAVESEDLNKTIAEYKHTIDILDQEGEDVQYRKYSFRELSVPILLKRESDVLRTTTFPATKNLYIDLLWRSNGKNLGYTKIDLDLYLHDTNNTNVTTSEDLDESSASTYSYERIIVPTTNTYFKEGIPERVGWYFYNKQAGINSTVDYMVRIYAYDAKILKHVYYGSFTTPPIQPLDGSFYFSVNITRMGDNYVVQDMPSVMKWTP